LTYISKYTIYKNSRLQVVKYLIGSYALYMEDKAHIL